MKKREERVILCVDWYGIRSHSEAKYNCHYLLHLMFSSVCTYVPTDMYEYICVLFVDNSEDEGFCDIC